MAELSTICWNCKHAVPTVKSDKSRGYATGCDWSINKRPVAGWVAEARTYMGYKNKQFERSYKVYHCPKFEKG